MPYIKLSTIKRVHRYIMNIKSLHAQYAGMRVCVSVCFVTLFCCFIVIWLCYVRPRRGIQ